MDWDATIEWCKSVGGELPPREVLLMCFSNEDIRKEFAETSYWSSTEFYATYTWVKHFSSGDEFYATKAYQAYARAVLSIKIGE
jgi:hypothetical protein